MKKAMSNVTFTVVIFAVLALCVAIFFVIDKLVIKSGLKDILLYLNVKNVVI